MVSARSGIISILPPVVARSQPGTIDVRAFVELALFRFDFQPSVRRSDLQTLSLQARDNSESTITDLDRSFSQANVSFALILTIWTDTPLSTIRSKSLRAIFGPWREIRSKFSAIRMLPGGYGAALYLREKVPERSLLYVFAFPGRKSFIASYFC
jgi:hypothetical protein